MTVQATRTFSHTYGPPRRGPAESIPGRGTGRGGGGAGGAGSCSPGGGSGDGWEQARFGRAGGWVFTLMHRDAAAVPVAINQWVLGPASLV